MTQRPTTGTVHTSSHQTTVANQNLKISHARGPAVKQPLVTATVTLERKSRLQGKRICTPPSGAYIRIMIPINSTLNWTGGRGDALSSRSRTECQALSATLPLRRRGCECENACVPDPNANAKAASEK
jgi:hypothetical protein